MFTFSDNILLKQRELFLCHAAKTWQRGRFIDVKRWQLQDLLVNIARPPKLHIVNLEMFDKLSFGIIIELLISFNFSCSCKNLNAYSFKYCWYFKISEFIKHLKTLLLVKISSALCFCSDLKLFKIAKSSSKHCESGTFFSQAFFIFWFILPHLLLALFLTVSFCDFKPWTQSYLIGCQFFS